MTSVQVDTLLDPETIADMTVPCRAIDCSRVAVWIMDAHCEACGRSKKPDRMTLCQPHLSTLLDGATARCAACDHHGPLHITGIERL